jgi:hypothetical protein
MFRSVSRLILLLAVCCQTTSLLAQRTVRVGVGVVPALNRTIDLGVEIGNGKNLEFFGQVGYMPEQHQRVNYEPGPGWFGYRAYDKSGGFLKIGGRLTTNQSRTWRVFVGPHLAGIVMGQNNLIDAVTVCDFCLPDSRRGYPSLYQFSNTPYLFSVGGSIGVSVQVLKRLEIDLGVELNKILSGEERLLQPDAYKPGIGSTPFQALVNVQYRLK